MDTASSWPYGCGGLSLISVAVGHLCYVRLLRSTFFQKRDLREQRQLIDKIAKYDQLTGLYERNEFLDQYEREFERARRYDEDLSVLMVDLDHFKDVNDTYGHSTGDDVLVQASAILEETVETDTRRSDVAGRYGGEEFILALPNADAEEAKRVGERIRTNMEQATFQADDETFNVTLSIGIAQLRPDDDTESLVNRADDALYQAKTQRNCVRTYEQSIANSTPAP